MQNMTQEKGGSVLPGYEQVAEAFAENHRSGLELGSAFAVYRDGMAVVDLWGGYADSARSIEVSETTLFSLWSTTKGLAAICVALLVERSILSYEMPVSDVWPEFAANGKQAITVAELMSHQAGVVAPREPVTIEDHYAHDGVAAALAAQLPFFGPGSWGYHTLTFGTLADELVRRVDGRPIGQFFAEEVAAKFRIDAFMGLPVSEDHRQAETVGAPDPQTLYFDPPQPAAFTAAMTNPMLDWNWPNERAWRKNGLAGAGGAGSARGLARLYSLLIGVPGNGETALLGPRTLTEAIRERISGVDQCSGGVGRYAAGFRLNTGTMGSNPASFGHPGVGGSVAFGDPTRRLGISYTPNRMINPNWQQSDPRLNRLLAALYSAEASVQSGTERPVLDA